MDLSLPQESRPVWWAPWRSAPWGWALGIAFLVIGVPLYWRMPPWCDITLYDVSAHTVMRGGVHFQDVFDTNLPGFVWLLILIRRTLGDGMEVLRGVDLLVVLAISLFCIRFAKRAGATRGGIAWLVAGYAFFYPYTSEFNHAQRDVWMLLPALGATWLRWRRLETQQRGLRLAFWEGVLWGCAIWIKPHVMVPLVAVWSLTAWRLCGSVERPWRALRDDALGYLAGGIFVGLAGLVWLAATGTLQPFLDVFRKWNNTYAQAMWAEFPVRVRVEFSYFPPYSLLMPLPLIVAVLNLWDARLWAKADAEPIGPVGRRLPGWLYDAGADANTRLARGVLAVLLLSWAAQALFFQRMFHYVHVPEIFLMLALAVANRWAIPALGIGYAAICGVIWLAADRSPNLNRELRVVVPNWTDQWVTVPRHPLAMPERLAWWPQCLVPGLPDREYRERMEAVALLPETFASIDPVQIGEVAEYLKSLGVQEGDVLCWHDSPHAVYLELGHTPPFRFMHLSTTMMGLDTYERMKRELIKTLPNVKYVVSDLKRVYLMADGEARSGWVEPGPGNGDLLPPNLPPVCRDVFPMYEPCLFRSGNGRGRYIVHRVTRPFGPYDNCYIPPWPEPEDEGEPGK